MLRTRRVPVYSNRKRLPVSRRLAAATSPVVDPVIETVAPPKRRRYLRVLLSTTILGSILAFGAGTFYARQNDNFYDFFTEYVPFGDHAVAYLEERDFREKYPDHFISKRSAAANTISVPREGTVARIVQKAENATASSKETAASVKDSISDNASKLADGVKGTARSVKDSVSNAATSVKETLSEGSSKSQDAAENAKNSLVTKKEEVKEDVSKKKDKVEASVADKKEEASQAFQEVKSKATKRFEGISLDNADPVIASLNAKMSKLADLLSGGETTDELHNAFESTKENIRQLNEQLKARAKEAAGTAKDSTAKISQDQIENLKAQISAAEENKWLKSFESEKTRLAHMHEDRLSNELQKLNETFETTLRNHLIEQAIEIERRWTRELKVRVEKERGGRLGRLDGLQKDIKALEAAFGDTSDLLDACLNSEKITIAANSVREAFEKQDVEGFAQNLAGLKFVSRGDDIIRTSIASINRKAYESGFWSLHELSDSFVSLSEEIRKVSLLPEDAGIIGHGASWLLSKVLFKREGLTKGNDVESVLSRTKYYLDRKDVDSATRELNQLEGWPKVLAENWLNQARIYLEIKQSLAVIDTELSLASLLRA